jgi:hypothetical protein
MIRRFGAMLTIVALYFATSEILARVTTDHGLLTPGGRLDPTIAALGAVVLSLRVLTLFIVPAIVIYRLLALATDSGDAS